MVTENPFQPPFPDVFLKRRGCLGVATYRAIQALVVAIHNHHQVIQPPRDVTPVTPFGFFLGSKEDLFSWKVGMFVGHMTGELFVVVFC